jgi:16S rRNA (guanine527-N7)-methyltransferase
MTDSVALFVQHLAEKSINLSAQQLAQFDCYFSCLIDWNNRMNLTAIVEKGQVYEKHFYDSATLSFILSMNNISSIIDIGSGAGFPSIPLKILFPHLQITIVDSLHKRITFLEYLTERLKLQDVRCIHGRAEDVAKLQQHREQHDLVTARAVARMHILSELCLPFARVGGIFVAMKGSDPHEELQEATYAIQQLGGRLNGIDEFTLPIDGSKRHLIQIDKVKATPAIYPRKPGEPAKQPLLPSK